MRACSEGVDHVTCSVLSSLVLPYLLYTLPSLTSTHCDSIDLCPGHKGYAIYDDVEFRLSLAIHLVIGIVRN